MVDVCLITAVVDNPARPGDFFVSASFSGTVLNFRSHYKSVGISESYLSGVCRFLNARGQGARVVNL